jgi:DNA-binding NtrC family response regulator
MEASLKQVRIMMIDDDKDFCELLSRSLQKKGAQTYCQFDSLSLTKNVNDFNPNIVLLDVMLPDKSGIELLSDIRRIKQDIPIIMISNREDTKMIVASMKAGASDYIPKTADIDELWEKIRKLHDIQLQKEVEGKIQKTSSIIGESYLVKNLLKLINQVAQSEAPVFLRGESGTGKSLIAEAIHQASPRRDGPFITINCPAIPSTLIESELFGHEKGSFTGAIKTKEGKFELAENGTVFLDEIGDLSIDLQVKILRVIQNKEFERVGGLKTIKTNARLIAATNSNVEKAVQEGRFREDLYYRLNVLPMYIPSLRERKDDIHVLVKHFLEICSKRENKNFMPISEDIINVLNEYSWPGNIRELENIVERAVILGKEPELKLSDFSINKGFQQQQTLLSTPTIETRINEQAVTSLRDIEYKNLMDALQKTSGNISKTAKILGMSRDTLYRKMKKYGIGLKN